MHQQTWLFVCLKSVLLSSCNSTQNMSRSRSQSPRGGGSLLFCAGNRLAHLLIQHNQWESGERAS